MPSDIIELPLNRYHDSRRAQALVTLAGRLLSLLAESAPEEGRAKADAFRSRVEGWRARLAAEHDPEALVKLANRVVDECDSFLDQMRSYRADREAEFVDLIRVLREVMVTVRGESRQFEDDLLKSTAAMERIVQLEDIRELKRALASEVGTLRRTVGDRQVAEAAQYDALIGRVKTLEDNLARARAEAATDALTSIRNRGAFDAALLEWLARATRKGQTFSLVLVDLDDFKKINDTHGHPVGDRVLMAAAQLLASGTNGNEVVARFGGEEFAMLLDTTAGVARDRVNLLLQRIPPAYEFESSSGRRYLTFTFSAGVTEFGGGDTAQALIKRADEALYEAKRRGKRRVEVRGRSLLRALIG